ncbi:MAG: class III extradiol dioxygenase subunit B-like domain-containing protein [Minisyncoccales bacterium]
MISFACFSPHPPLLLPEVGSPEDREKVKKTIENLKFLGKKLKATNPDTIIISSPHPDWGFDVPLYFLNPKQRIPSRQLFIPDKTPDFYYERGKQFYNKLEKDKKYALIASGDMSHCLKENGPYAFHPDGPKFDKALIEYLKKKDIKSFFKLDEYFPNAGECGLRSFSFILGILDASSIDWQPEILSYESPFGVGYLVVNFKLR